MRTTVALDDELLAKARAFTGLTPRSCMILVDISLWIDHFGHDDPVLSQSLNQRQALFHPFVIEELALGGLRQRDPIF